MSCLSVRRRMKKIQEQTRNKIHYHTSGFFHIYLWSAQKTGKGLSSCTILASGVHTRILQDNAKRILAQAHFDMWNHVNFQAPWASSLPILPHIESPRRRLCSGHIWSRLQSLCKPRIRGAMGQMCTHDQGRSCATTHIWWDECTYIIIYHISYIYIYIIIYIHIHVYIIYSHIYNIYIYTLSSLWPLTREPVLQQHWAFTAKCSNSTMALRGWRRAGRGLWNVVTSSVCKNGSWFDEVCVRFTPLVWIVSTMLSKSKLKVIET